MAIHLNRESVQNLVCAAFLVGAIGFTAAGASTGTCAAPRLVRGDLGTKTEDVHPCNVPEPGATGRVRPGMRVLPN